VSNRIVQSDNAVVDYTTITALINAVNDLQVQVDTLNSNTNHINTTVDASGNVVQKSVGPTVVHSGHQPFVAGQSYVDITYPNFSSNPTLVATCSDNTGVARYAYFSGANLPKTSSARINITPTPTKASGYVWWIVVGS
jgi:uncharacterized membrane protein